MPKNDHSSWSKEDLIEKINSLGKRKKYGLVWDSALEPGKVVLDCQKELPVPKKDKTEEIISNPNEKLVESADAQGMEKALGFQVKEVKR